MLPENNNESEILQDNKVKTVVTDFDIKCYEEISCVNNNDIFGFHTNLRSEIKHNKLKFDLCLTSSDIIHIKNFLLSNSKYRLKMNAIYYYNNMININFIRQKADILLQDRCYLSATRYYIEATILALESNQNPEYFCESLERVAKDLLPCTSFEESLQFFLETVRKYDCDIQQNGIINVARIMYRSLIILLNTDDLCDIDDTNYNFMLVCGNGESLSETKNLTDLFYDWIKMYNYKNIVPDIDYFCHLKGLSKGYRFLWGHFLKEIFDYFPENSSKYGYILLKLANEIDIYQPELALKFSKKAISVFKHCNNFHGLELASGLLTRCKNITQNNKSNTMNFATIQETELMDVMEDTTTDVNNDGWWEIDLK